MRKIFNKNNIIPLFLSLIIIIGLIIIIITKLNSDGMANEGIVNVYYRTYTSNNGWSKWSKNAITSGNKEDDITNIQIKVKNNKDGFIRYSLYNNDNWSKEYDINSKIKNNSFNAIKIALTDALKIKYDICYRTYNEKNKWLEWTCDYDISGNEKMPVRAIEVKIIPKNVMKYDYLKDYNKTQNNQNVGF